MNKLFIIFSIICIVSLVGCQNNNVNTDINTENNPPINENYSGNEIQTVETDETTEKIIKSGAYSYLDDPTRYSIQSVDLDMISDWDIILPSELDGKEMFTFWANDFEGNENITSLTIPANYVGILGSFKNCKNLKRVIVDNSHIQILSGGIFAGCENLEEVVLKQDIEIGIKAFENCKNLKSIVGPGKIKEIGRQAFMGCESLEKIDAEIISECSIDDDAFFNCVKFNKSSLPSNAKYGDNVFGTEDNTYLIEKSNVEKIDLGSGKGWRITNFEYSKKELEIAKNEIFARYGHDFDSKELANYFAGQKWYKKVPGKKVSYSSLNEIERYNVDILDKYIGITKEMEEGNGSAIYYKDGIINVYILKSKRPEGKTISLEYELANKKGKTSFRSSGHLNNQITNATFYISTELRELLDNNVKLSCYIDDKLYAEKEIFIDKMCEIYDFYNDLIIKSDKSFEVKGWTSTYKAVDKNGKELKLFDITSGRTPLNTSFFGDRFIADDGYLYSFNRLDEKNVKGSKVYCSKISDKKIASYSLNITKIIDDSDTYQEFPLYNISIIYQYEDGTNYTEKLVYVFYPV